MTGLIIKHTELDNVRKGMAAGTLRLCLVRILRRCLFEKYLEIYSGFGYKKEKKRKKFFLFRRSDHVCEAVNCGGH